MSRTDNAAALLAHDTQAPSEDTAQARAVIYLRVSTKEQAEMGGEAEGFSIPAQRSACLRKAEALGATVEAEFVDRGESAKTANRPELTQMLRYLQEHAILYVIVHKIDRLARNRADDVAITLQIQNSGARLVSCSENIDETPSGLLLHGIMSSIAEFYSRNLANEVIKGMKQKAKTGGTVGKAPVGYLHVRKMENGREVRTVEIDPERGPLMKAAFELYATGDWTLRQLLEELTQRGLTSRPGPTRPAGRVSLASFAASLANPYYIGMTTYSGAYYPGKHPPLVSKLVFDRVQDVLVGHNHAGEKQRIYNHYLKGSIFCGKCGSRLGIANSRSGNGNLYDYFFCLGRQRDKASCDQSVIRIGVVQRQVEKHYWTVQLPPERIEAIREHLRDALSVRRVEAEAAEHVETLRIRRLTDERKKLLNLHYADAVPVDLFKQEQQRITQELEQAHGRLAAVSLEFDAIEKNMNKALELARDCRAAYLMANTTVRRLFNQAFFEKLYIHEDGEVTHDLAKPFKILLDPALPEHLARVSETAQDRTEPGRQWNGSTGQKWGQNAFGPDTRAESSNYEFMVAGPGLEPGTP
ncbi:MAG: recombinase family protein [Thermoleophilia bacterium]